MVLAPHAVAGAATMLIFRQHPVIGFFAAFASHFLLDAIPHWHYDVASIRKDPSQRFGFRLTVGKNSLLDFIRIAIDFSLGLIFTWLVSKWFFPHHFALMTVGAFAGAFPDALQIPYYFFPNSPIKYLQQFHVAIHSKKRIDDKHAFGIAFQVIFSAAILALLALV